MDKFISCTEDPVGKTEAFKVMDPKSPIKYFSVRMLMLSLLTAASTAQNPPTTGNPYVSRGNPKSPNGKYEWILRTTNPIRYELVDVLDGKGMVTVNAYYPDANRANIQYAKACGIFALFASG